MYTEIQRDPDPAFYSVDVSEDSCEPSSNIYELINFKTELKIFLYPPQREHISFVNTFVTPRNNDLGPYVPWRHLISAKF